MKKSVIYILLTLTLMFLTFIAGLYMGQNMPNTDIHIHGGIHSTPAASSALSNDPSSSSSDHASIPSSGVGGSSRPVFPININTATAEELDLLPDIGPVRAQAIITYREEYGPFTSVEDLIFVEGIGEKTLAKILEYITV